MSTSTTTCEHVYMTPTARLGEFRSTRSGAVSVEKGPSLIARIRFGSRILTANVHPNSPSIAGYFENSNTIHVWIQKNDNLIYDCYFDPTSTGGCTAATLPSPVSPLAGTNIAAFWDSGNSRHMYYQINQTANPIFETLGYPHDGWGFGRCLVSDSPPGGSPAIELMLYSPFQALTGRAPSSVRPWQLAAPTLPRASRSCSGRTSLRSTRRS